MNERELKRIQDGRNLTENKREKTDRKVIFQMVKRAYLKKNLKIFLLSS